MVVVHMFRVHVKVETLKAMLSPLQARHGSLALGELSCKIIAWYRVPAYIRS